MVDNIGGGVGRLPNAAMRKRMADVIDAIPLALPAQALERYVGEYASTNGQVASFRREGETLFVQSGNDAELPLVAMSPQRFTNRKGSVFEFRFTGQGPATRVTGVVLEKGSEKVLLERK